MRMLIEGWLCRKGWDSRHQSHHHLHWWEDPSSVQGADSCSGYWASWGEDAPDHRGLLCHGKELDSFSCSSKMCVLAGKHLLSPSCNPWATNRRRYWETTYLVTGQPVQCSWVGPRHLAQEASHIWQRPSSSAYSPGEQNPVVYLISMWQCCLGCQSESSQTCLWLPESNGDNTERRTLNGFSGQSSILTL